MQTQESQKPVRMFRTLLILPIRLYQTLVSPFLPSSCIYHPTCSHYAADSILRFGLIRGVFMGLLRIFRCNGLFQGGEDPVPEVFTVRETLHSYALHWRHQKTK